MPSEQLCVIAFDVASNRRRYRIARLLLGYGWRVQESVFEAWLDDAALQRLLRQAAGLLDPKHDLLVSYALTSDDHARVAMLGCAQTTPNPEFHIL